LWLASGGRWTLDHAFLKAIDDLTGLQSKMLGPFKPGVLLKLVAEHGLVVMSAEDVYE